MKTRSMVILAALALLVTLPAMAAGSDGAAIYKTKCAPCHGADGGGVPSRGIENINWTEPGFSH